MGTFYEKMHIVCCAIPEGKVASYGQIAMLCGKPRNARQVGAALKKNLAGEVPAWRVVNSRGELSGAKHFELEGMQQHLLREEGVPVEWNGVCWCVDLGKFGWRPTEEELQKAFDSSKIVYSDAYYETLGIER